MPFTVHFILCFAHATQFVPYQGATMLGSPENIAQVLYTDYRLAFEGVAVLLLVAIIAAIALSQRETQAGALKQRVAKQIAADPSTRIRMVNMEAE